MIDVEFTRNIYLNFLPSLDLHTPSALTQGFFSFQLLDTGLYTRHGSSSSEANLSKTWEFSSSLSEK